MALTNKGLRETLSKAGVDAEHMSAAVSEIMEGHNATVDALKEERDTARADVAKYKPDAEKLPIVQRKLDDLRAAKWEDKYNAEHTELEGLKADIAAKEARAAKEDAVRAYLQKASIVDGNLDIAMMATAGLIDALDVKKDGTIKDVSALDALIAGKLAPLVSRDIVTATHEPPASTLGSIGASDGIATIDDIYKIEDSTARQEAIAKHPALFGY